MASRYFSKSTLKHTAAFFLMVFATTSVALAGSGPLYPDLEIDKVSDNQFVIKYKPALSNDYLNLRHADLVPIDGKSVWGRSFSVAVPPDGDLMFETSYKRLTTVEKPADGRFITEITPLAMRTTDLMVRGRRLVKISVFPQRLEGNRLVLYSDFEITIRLTGQVLAGSHVPPANRLDSIAASTVINPDQFLNQGRAIRQGAVWKSSVDLFDSDAQWVKVTVEESGVTQIFGSALILTGIDATDLISDSIRIFYGGGKNPPYDPSATPLNLYEINIQVNDGGDGKLDSGDNIRFYAESANRYEFDGGEPVYIKNYYNLQNYYWVAVGGYQQTTALRWGLANGQPTGTPDRVVDFTYQSVRAEKDLTPKINGFGRIWNYFNMYWDKGPNITTQINLPNYSGGDSLDIKLTAIGSYSDSKMSINGQDLSGYYSGGRHFWTRSGAVSGLNTLNIELIPALSGTYLDYLDITYPMSLNYSNKQFEFNSYSFAGLIQYRISGYGTSQNVLEITYTDQPRLVSGVEIMSDTARFELFSGGAVPSRFVIYGTDDIKSPVTVEEYERTTLRSDLERFDCIAISPRSFQNALSEYVDYRAVTTGRKVKLVAVEDIYDCFGFGHVSPMAIRSYLQYAFEMYDVPAPFAVLLVGDGHYDYLDNLQYHVPSYIPPYTWSTPSSAGDDYFVYFGKLDSLDSDNSYDFPYDRGWDMMVARWPVRSSSEVESYIAKLKQYESPESFGSWRGRITYVADDEFKGQNSNEIIHTAQIESLSVFHTPPAFERKKIYLTEYPFASNGEKPLVNDAIINAVNEGTLMLNYIGHGSADVWADEHVMKKSSDLGRMHNEDKLTVIVAASCSIGHFDAPDREGMGEMMFRQNGGAVSVISAIRLVYSTDNAIFNYDLYDAIFGGQYNLCEAAYATKMLHQYNFNSSLIRNDRSYAVFSDPLANIGLPVFRLEFDLDADSLLIPLEVARFSGRVVDTGGNPIIADGVVDVTVFDSPTIREHELGISYSLSGPTIYRGQAVVSGGSFEGEFIVPLDIDYGSKGARLSGFASLSDGTAIGSLDSLEIADQVSQTDDDSGPLLEYTIEGYPDFITGDRIPANATLVVDISDNSGINLTGGLAHRIEITFDNDNNSTLNLTDLFEYNPGDYQSGSLEFTLPDLTPERHLFRIRAWDNANNPAVVEFEATPSEIGRLIVTNVMNYPNPMEEATEFFFDLSESAESAELRIFTLAGRLIKTFREERPIVGNNRLFHWDGRDADGDRVAQGVYIFKLIILGRVASDRSSADNVVEAFGKLVLLN